MSKFIPNSFQVPNAVVDELMSVLSGAEFKCYMLVVRQTTGWNKQKDAVSISQMMEKCNLSNRGVIDACDKLVEMGLLTKSKGYRGMNVFSVNFDKIPTCEVSSPVNSAHSTCEVSSQVPVNSAHSTCEVSSQVPVNSAHTQNTTKQNNNTKNNTLTGVNACEKKSETLMLLEQFGITEQLAKDFIVHRKSFKAPITETALKGFQREADKAKIPIQQAIVISIERGWRGFNAGWDWQNDGVSAKNPQNPSARNTSKPFIPDDEGNWAEGMSITLRGS
ncbi:replication protein [Glaesserella parasuis]|nr:replication protein [Glaesserella parasuis]MCT8707296.1 replication protein [Glaesserella parasuis]MCT8709450.1 replication protein [Glaesserella parasuis]MCT8711491.1 replication protein [Glaesserella parasuis]MCT8713624.1 replication protein [Glaesserella parasuis]